MGEAPPFFVPESAPETVESDYAGLAELCERGVPEPGDRIYSLEHEHNGARWTVIVGEPLRGLSRPDREGRSQDLGDPAVVLAIFQGDPFMVVTNYQFVSGVESAWGNPFFVRVPESIVYFGA